jgi:hypothetical protein
MNEPTIAFLADDGIRVNFGMYAGREATQAEIDDLGRALLAEIDAVTIVGEHRTVLDRTMEASVHQVHVELPEGLDEASVERAVTITREWADACVAERRVEISEV